MSFYHNTPMYTYVPKLMKFIENNVSQLEYLHDIRPISIPTLSISDFAFIKIEF